MTAPDQPPVLAAGDLAGDGAAPATTEPGAPTTLGQLMLARQAGAPAARGLRQLTGGRSIAPLAILFALAVTVWADRAAVAVLAPDIQRDFGLNDLGLEALALASTQLGIILTVGLAHRGDRGQRARITLVAATLFALFALASTVVPPSWWTYLLTRAGAAIGLAAVLSTHLSLLADHYDIAQRPKVFAVHTAAMALGSVAGIAIAQQVGDGGGWRLAQTVIVAPTLGVLLLAGRRLTEPSRGRFERVAMGVTGEALSLQEEPPSFEESQRMVQRVESLRRLFFAMPFLAIMLAGFASTANLFLQREFGTSATEQWRLTSIAGVGQLAGVAVAAVVGTRLVRRDPAAIVRVVLIEAIAAAAFVAAMAAAPTVPLAAVARIGLSATLAAILPSILVVLSLAVPARARSTGFSVAVLYLLPGMLLIAFLEGWIADTFGIRIAVAVLALMLLLGGYLAASMHGVLDRDIRNVWTATAARSELLAARRRGEIKQLLVRDLDVFYGDVQVLFGVDVEVAEGEIIALLGTNGAGKSTLLRAVTGLVPASRGAIVFDGRDITASPPHEIANLGISMVPGGQGVFPSLSVADNLKVASWGNRRRERSVDGPAGEEDVEQVLVTFPILRERLADPAGNLSGGQQQMLALGMAFLSQPKLLVIDELSLGLAPVIVEQLLDIVRAIRDQGTTVILVEQSVNVALTLAETAYFMEKGAIRFHGPTADLLERPDVLRSVFLEGAAAHLEATDANGGGNRRGAVRTEPRSPSATVTAAAPGAPALEVAHLSVRFGGILALDGVSLSVAPGEVVGVIGPNGAGKTTMFDLVSGFTRADTGRILLGGLDISRLGPDGRARRGLGRSFQDARLFPAMTVEDTIKVALERFVTVRDPFNAMLRLPVQQSSEHALSHWVGELIELVGIGDFRSKFVRELSTGSRRIVDLACVLAHRPSVVLLDEPSSGIAQRESESLAPLILRIRDALGAAIVLIEHDMPLVTAASDRLVALDQGRVVVDGSAPEVLSHPVVVASYLGNRDEVIARSGRAGTRADPTTHDPIEPPEDPPPS